jgi:hypothetical protein
VLAYQHSAPSNPHRRKESGRYLSRKMRISRRERRERREH